MWFANVTYGGGVDFLKDPRTNHLSIQHCSSILKKRKKNHDIRNTDHGLRTPDEAFFQQFPKGLGPLHTVIWGG